MLTRVGVLPTTGGEFGYFAGIALWIGSATLGAVMLAIRVFPLGVGLAFTITAPLAMIGLLAGTCHVRREVSWTSSPQAGSWPTRWPRLVARV